MFHNRPPSPGHATSVPEAGSFTSAYQEFPTRDSEWSIERLSPGSFFDKNTPLSWRRLVNATEQQLFADDESESGDYSPPSTENPVKRERTSDEQQIPDGPSSNHARPFPRVPLGALVHRLIPINSDLPR